MAEKELESDDPYELVALRFPMEPGTDGQEAMTRCFVEEYAVMGVPRDRLMQLFRSAAFVGTHAVYEERGEAFVKRIVDEVLGADSATEVA